MNHESPEKPSPFFFREEKEDNLLQKLFVCAVAIVFFMAVAMGVTLWILYEVIFDPHRSSMSTMAEQNACFFYWLKILLPVAGVVGLGVGLWMCWKIYGPERYKI